MMDLPAMDPCPVDPNGQHKLVGWVMSTDANEPTATQTWTCGRCGAMRRVPAFGSLVPASPLDDVPADAWTSVGGQWEVR